VTARVTRRAALLGPGLGMLAACGGSNVRGRLRIAAGESGGLYLAFAELLAGRLRARHPDLSVQVLRTEGSVDNLDRLVAGSADLGLCLADVAELAPAPEGVTALARVYENYLQVLVPAHSSARQVGHLRGRRVAAGARRSGAAVTSDLLLDEAGLRGRVAVDFEPLASALGDLRSGRVDAVVWSGGVPTPAVADLDAEFPVRLLPLGGHAAGMADRSGYGYVARVVPTVGYSEPGLRTIGVPNLLMGRKGLADRHAAAVLETLVVEASHLVPGFVRGLQYLDPPVMIQTGRIPLHPAAAAAYRRLHG
jgi:TRAP transporter TAXI family solute receptor